MDAARSRTATPRLAALSTGQSRVLEMVAAGAPLGDTLDFLVRLIEAHIPNVFGSILLLDEDGVHLRHGAAPSLPEAFVHAIDGEPIGPCSGSCGTAAYRGERVVVEDIRNDPLWASYRELAAQHKLRASWSTPIFDEQRKVLGTFAMYFRKPLRPSKSDLRVIEVVTHTAAIAVVKDHSERERARLVRTLDERVKELSVLHEAARLLQTGCTVDAGLLDKLVVLLPPSWQYPDVCAARIVYGDREARTRQWRDSRWRQSVRFGTADGRSGLIEVAYLKARPAAAEGPFLAEERRLIQSVADMLAAHLERICVQAALLEREAMFRSVFENAAMGITLTDMQGRIEKCNAAFARMLGYREDELVGWFFSDITHPEDIDANLRLYRELVAGERTHFQLNKRYLHRDGGVIWAQITVSLVPLGEGAPRFTLGMIEDITARKLAEARVEHLATHDGLTDLPNRNLIHDRITQAINHTRRGGRPFAVMYIDLDRFKIINDGFGHPFGDGLLKAVGERLVGTIRDGDTVARQTGDEFLVLLADLGKVADAYIIAQKVLEVFAQPFVLEGREIHVGASLGVSVYPQDGQTADALIGNADVAMYRAKGVGGNTCQFFTREMSDETRRRVEIETQLRSALAQRQLHLVYQPKVDLASGRIAGCEALLRWNHPTLGAISPGRFIPIAEDSGLIVPISDWVLRTACAQNRAWQDAGLPPIVVSVNLSARQFLQQDVAAWVLKALEETGLAADRLELELTESLLAQDTENVIDTVNRLKAAGVKLSIDDFGTGYSSLSYLKRFNVDTLKIDQSFVRNVLTDPDDATIALAVISLAHSLRMTAVAEGVETAEQCGFLRQNGCDAMQGYYFSRPVPSAALAELLAEGKRLVV